MLELGWTAHFDYTVYTAGLYWNQDNRWILGWAGLIWCHILHTQNAEGAALRRIQLDSWTFM